MNTNNDPCILIREVVCRYFDATTFAKVRRDRRLHPYLNWMCRLLSYYHPDDRLKRAFKFSNSRLQEALNYNEKHHIKRFVIDYLQAEGLVRIHREPAEQF